MELIVLSVDSQQRSQILGQFFIITRVSPPLTPSTITNITPARAAAEYSPYVGTPSSGDVAPCTASPHGRRSILPPRMSSGIYSRILQGTSRSFFFIAGGFVCFKLYGESRNNTQESNQLSTLPPALAPVPIESTQSAHRARHSVDSFLFVNRGASYELRINKYANKLGLASDVPAVPMQSNPPTHQRRRRVRSFF
jgi:hypothetical protein